MKPRPPTSTSTRITVCPNPLQWVAVSTTVSPVTHTAEVAVNAACNKFVERPAAVERGSRSSAVPAEIAPTNQITT